MSEDSRPEVHDVADHQTRLRLHLLTGIDSALRHHQEVFGAIGISADRQEAIAAVGALLGVDETQAQAVLDLQWNQLTTTKVQEIADEVARLGASLDDG